jgi:LysB family phage lysis regulatory protein
MSPLELIRPYIAKAIAALALIVAAAVLWLYVHGLQSDLKSALADVQVKAELADERGATIERMRVDQQANAEAISRLEEYRTSIDATQRKRESTLEGLKRENEDVRKWADAAVPAGVVSLYERPAITGAAQYVAMRAGRAVQPASSVGANQ